MGFDKVVPKRGYRYTERWRDYTLLWATDLKRNRQDALLPKGVGEFNEKLTTGGHQSALVIGLHL